MNTKLLTLTAAALVAAAPMAFANGVSGGTITEVDAAAGTISISGTEFAVAPSVNLAQWHEGQRVNAYVNDHGSHQTIERLFYRK